MTQLKLSMKQKQAHRHRGDLWLLRGKVLGEGRIGSLGLLLLLNRFSRVWLCNPIDGSPPGFSVPGILQARTLEWVAISFSNAWKWKVKVKSFSRVRLLATPWTAAYQAPPLWDFPGKSTGVGCHCLLQFGVSRCEWHMEWINIKVLL